MTSDRIGFFEIVSLLKMCQVSLTLSNPYGPLRHTGSFTPPIGGSNRGSLGKLFRCFCLGGFLLVVSSRVFLLGKSGEICGMLGPSLFATWIDLPVILLPSTNGSS